MMRKSTPKRGITTATAPDERKVCMADIKVCPECGSEEVIEGYLVSHGTVRFYEVVPTSKIPRSSAVLACACSQCGTVFNLKLENPGFREKKKRKE